MSADIYDELERLGERLTSTSAPVTMQDLGGQQGPTIDAPTVDDIDVAFGAVYAEPGNSEDAHWASPPSLRSSTTTRSSSRAESSRPRSVRRQR